MYSQAGEGCPCWSVPEGSVLNTYMWGRGLWLNVTSCAEPGNPEWERGDGKGARLC